MVYHQETNCQITILACAKKSIIKQINLFLPGANQMPLTFGLFPLGMNH